MPAPKELTEEQQVRYDKFMAKFRGIPAHQVACSLRYGHHCPGIDFQGSAKGAMAMAYAIGNRYGRGGGSSVGKGMDNLDLDEAYKSWKKAYGSKKKKQPSEREVLKRWRN